MYLSRIRLDTRYPGVRQCLVNCQDMHRSLMKFFDCSREEAGVLYRFAPEYMKVYILSSVEPQSTMQPQGFILEGIQNTEKIEKNFAPNCVYAFDLLASPCKKVKIENKKNSRRKGFDTTEEKLLWLNRKAEQNGFAVHYIQESDEPVLYGKHDSENGGEMHLNVVRYTGKIEILDQAKFLNVWQKGIGPGRAYGLGMLIVKGL